MRYALFAALLLAAGSLLAYPAGSPAELYDTESLSLLDGGESRLFSSYDRAGGNNDGFDGLYSTVRKENGRYVVFDQKGPGAIMRIWFPEWNGLDADFEIEIDGRKAVSVPSYRAFGDGSVFPFIKGLGWAAMGGVVTCAPIPFQERCVISCSKPIYFYHFNYRLYEPGTKTETFGSPEYRNALEKAAEVLGAAGENPNSLKNAETEKKTVTLEPGKETVIAEFDGPGRVLGIRLKAVKAEALGCRSLWLRTRTDGKETVFCPLGDFFLDGFGKGGVKSLLFGSDKGSYYCYAPMPFSEGWRFAMENKGREKAELEVEVTRDKAPFPKGSGLFYALWNRRKPAAKDQQPFAFLDAKGRGRIISTGLYTDCRSGLACLEGDEMAWIDGRDNSFYNGTGTEDCFGGGWYFSGRELSLPLYGCTYLAESEGRCSMYRLYISDSLFFDGSILFSIERGAENSVPAEYAGVTCFYGEDISSWNIAHEGGWFPNPPGEAGVAEAEDAGSPGCQIINDYGRPVRFSHGEAVKTAFFGSRFRTGKAAGVSLRFMGDAWAVIDGKDAVRIQSDTLEILNPFEELEPGEHFLALTAQEGQFVLDWFRPEPARGWFEGEGLEYERSGSFDVGYQEMSGFGPGWSGNAHLFIKGEKPGDFVEYKLPAEPGEAFALTAWLTTAPDYGILKIYADGKLLKEVDCYTPGVERREISLGDVVPSDSCVKLRLEVSGKNPASAGCYSGADAFYQSNRGVEK
ncbi:MAG: DUF2961 domain-containing protein [Abditibacteriota bacterium]|nr:DUF2961 domain-containing protein [Abditibacteriota bacterium]